MTQSTVLYRYHNHADVLFMETYPVTKHTPCGCWIDLGYREKRFILNDSRKRFAYPTKEEAKASFLARKKRQLGILRAQITAVEGALKALSENRLNDYRGSAYHFEDF